MTYCINSGCPFKDCKNHVKHAPKNQKYITVSNMDGVCRKYLSYLLDEVIKENKFNNKETRL